VISLVTLGNPFPVTEHPFSTGGTQGKMEDGYYGQPCRIGYQSHFTVVQQASASNAFPVKGEINQGSAMEYVVFESSQALPLFLIYYQNDSSFHSPSPSPSFSQSELLDLDDTQSRFCSFLSLSQID